MSEIFYRTELENKRFTYVCWIHWIDTKYKYGFCVLCMRALSRRALVCVLCDRGNFILFLIWSFALLSTIQQRHNLAIEGVEQWILRIRPSDTHSFPMPRICNDENSIYWIDRILGTILANSQAVSTADLCLSHGMDPYALRQMAMESKSLRWEEIQR